ncbi:hypothetical protein B6A42_27040 (plasmid) [Vibrio coralliilyticus]|nr:hypothetical protein B6A42_27040 [Vibrio coralliilyticus]
MSIKAFPARYGCFTEASKMKAVHSVGSSLDGIDNLYQDMATSGFHDLDDLCYMFLQMLPERHCVGTLCDLGERGAYFVSNECMHHLIMEVGDERGKYGDFDSVIRAFLDHGIGSDFRKEFGHELELHLNQI